MSVLVVLSFVLCHIHAQPTPLESQKDSILQSAVLGADYLLNAMYTNGKFIYEYNPKTGHRSYEYNILRHAGTTYALLEVYEITQAERFLNGAKQALGYLQSTILPCKSTVSNTNCVVENGQVKLGGNALAIIAMAKYTSVTNDDQYVPIMQSMARWIRETMGRYGQFKVHVQNHPQGQTLPFQSNYYPGEALLALNRLYAIDKDTTWLDTAEKGAKWLITIRDRNKTVDNIDHDHWLLYALNDLAKYRPKPLYINHAYRITDAILLRQRQEYESDNPKWIGSYYTPPRSTPTATRTEGLVAAYQMAFHADDKVRSDQILKGIKLGVRFQLETQCTLENSKNFRHPSRPLGGFFESLDKYNIRIDYVQHNISALLGYYNILSDNY